MSPEESSVVVREAAPHEYAEVGRVTAEAYRPYVHEGENDWLEYIESIADVEGRADRTTILVALDAGRIVGSASLELLGRVEPETIRPWNPRKPTSGCSGCIRPSSGAASHDC